MDDNDIKLISLLQDNARNTLKKLSEKIFLSSPAVAARIEKLQREGIITGYHADVNYEKLGYHIIAFIHVEMSPKEKPGFIAFAKEDPSVIECNIVSGNYTMLVKAAFRSTSEMERFVSRVQRYGTTETHIVFSTPVPARGIRLDNELKENSI